MGGEESFITMKLICHSYLVPNLDIGAHETPTETDLIKYFLVDARWKDEMTEPSELHRPPGLSLRNCIDLQAAATKYPQMDSSSQCRRQVR